MDPREAAGRQPLRDFFGAGVGGQLDRKGHHHARIRVLGAGHQLGINRLRRVVPHQLSGLLVKELRGAGVEQLQVIIQLGHGADCRARAANRIGLVNGDGRRHAIDFVDRRLVHAVQKLPRVGGEGFDVAALAFGKKRVKHQRRLARPAGAGDHR